MIFQVRCTLVLVDEEALAPDRVDTNAEASDTGILNVIGILAGLKGLDTALGESCCGHEISLAIELQIRRNPLANSTGIAETREIS